MCVFMNNYIKFRAVRSADKMNVSRFKIFFETLAIGILKSIIPVANPDFDDKIDSVEYWLVECDEVSGVPEREIGLDQQGRVIAKMPFKANCGCWTDSTVLFTDFKKSFNASMISKEVFEQHWTQFAVPIA